MIKVIVTKKVGWKWFPKKIKSKLLIPSSWNDVTYGQWKAINQTQDELEIASILIGLPADSFDKLSEKSLYQVNQILSFIRTPMDIKNHEPPKELKFRNRKIPLVKDITEKTFGQKIIIHQIIKDSDEDITNNIQDIILVYAQPYIDNSKFDIDRCLELRDLFDDLFLVDLYSTAFYYIKQLKGIIANEVDQLDSSPTSEQVHAGISMYEMFGVLNTVKALAGGGKDWALHQDKVMELEYNLAFVSMLMNKTDGVFEKNYRKILKNKR